MTAVLCTSTVTHSAALPTSLLHDDSGQGLAEYGLILGFIAVLCVAALVFVGNAIKGNLNNIGSGV